MDHKLKKINLLATIAIAALSGGCEPDDPKIRAEVAELRAKVAELEKKAGAAREPAAAPAASTSGLSRETLRRNLDERMPALRAALTRAFPGYRVDPVNAATISIPQDSDYLPYSTEVSFGLSLGQSVASFSIRIGADRAGIWQMPDFEDLAASVGNLASPNAMSRASSERGVPSQSETIETGVRLIQWPEDTGMSGTSISHDQASPTVPQHSPQGSQPMGNLPLPINETRTIQFD